MKQWLTKRIKKLFENIESTITTVIVLALLGGSIGILALSKKALTFFLQIINIPTPIWATTLLVLLVFAYLKIRKPHSSSKSNYITEYFIIGNYKWETKIYNTGSFFVEQYPYCVIHDLKFIFENSGKYCPGTENETCKNKLSEYDEFKVFESAKSIIENKIRNKKC